MPSMPEFVQDGAELASLWLSVPTILLAVMVVFRWGGAAIQFVVERKDLTARDWLVLGIAVGFFGGLADNLYWGAAWTADFVGSDAKQWLFRHGVYPNIFFRQACGAYAAYCHLMAFHIERKTGKRRVNLKAGVALLLGAVLAAWLAAIRWMK